MFAYSDLGFNDDYVIFNHNYCNKITLENTEIQTLTTVTPMMTNTTFDS